MSEIIADLFAMQDIAYRDFQAKLLPNLPKSTVIGVRTPALRAYARQIKDSEKAKAFLQSLPHCYYEENQLHAFLIEQIMEESTLYAALEAFLPYIDNWATCDMLSPKRFGKCPPDLARIRRWLDSPHSYTVRFGVNLLMKHYLGARFTPEILELAKSCDHSEDYYRNMGLAWFFATALTRQYEAALPYLIEGSLSLWVHNKAISKACDSRQIADQKKAYLRSLRR